MRKCTTADFSKFDKCCANSSRNFTTGMAVCRRGKMCGVPCPAPRLTCGRRSKASAQGQETKNMFFDGGPTFHREIGGAFRLCDCEIQPYDAPYLSMMLCQPRRLKHRWCTRRRLEDEITHECTYRKARAEFEYQSFHDMLSSV